MFYVCSCMDITHSDIIGGHFILHSVLSSVIFDVSVVILLC